MPKVICPSCHKEVPYESYKMSKFCPNPNCGTFLTRAQIVPETRVESLQSLFKEAFKLWHERLPNESPKIGSPTYDHFQKLGKAIGDQAIKVYGGLKVKASAGMMGRWSEIPWIGLRNPYLTDSFLEGEYVVYLLSPDYNALYLGIIQGITKLTPDELAERTPRLRREITKPKDFIDGLEGHLAIKSLYNSKPDKYERGLLYSKLYYMKSPPAEEILLNDLKAALSSYHEYVNKNV